MSLSIPDDLPRRVLIVDDEDAILNMLSNYLTGHGFQVVTARTGEDGLAQLEEILFGCLLVDKNLPGMNGLELIGHTRERQPYCPCIVITGYASKQSVIESLRLGAVDYIEKPFSALDLVQRKVQNALGNARARLERAQLQARVATLHDELGLAEAAAERQETQFDMLNRVLAARVKSALQEANNDAIVKLEHLVEYVNKQRGGDDPRAALERVGLVLADLVRSLRDPHPEPLVTEPTVTDDPAD